MEMLTKNRFDQLVQVEGKACVTLLMPTHSMGSDNAQDPIRFKNLLQAAEEELVSEGVRAADARKRLTPLRQLLDDSLFWSHQSAGLAVFSSPEENVVVGVAEPLEECAAVDRRFHLVPLLPAFESLTSYFLLAISPKSVRLFKATRDGCEEVGLPEPLETFEEFMRSFEAEKQLQFHTRAAPTRGGQRAAVFHGHPGGESDSQRKLRLAEYCRLVDGRLRPALQGRKEPLVLACDKRLAPIYRAANSYAHLVETPVAGNPDLQPPAELASQAWDAVRPTLARRRERLKNRFEMARTRGLVAHELADVLGAILEGRVDSLLVAGSVRQWGRVLSKTNTVLVHAVRQPGDEELINLATLAALRRGAAVDVLPLDEMPLRQALAATMRYAKHRGRVGAR